MPLRSGDSEGDPMPAERQEFIQADPRIRGEPFPARLLLAEIRVVPVTPPIVEDENGAYREAGPEKIKDGDGRFVQVAVDPGECHIPRSVLAGLPRLQGVGEPPPHGYDTAQVDMGGSESVLELLLAASELSPAEVAGVPIQGVDSGGLRKS